MPNPLPHDRSRDESLSAEGLASLQGVGPVTSVEDAMIDIWEDDAEVDAFIEDVRRSRRANAA